MDLERHPQLAWTSTNSRAEPYYLRSSSLNTPRQVAFSCVGPGAVPTRISVGLAHAIAGRRGPTDGQLLAVGAARRETGIRVIHRGDHVHTRGKYYPCRTKVALAAPPVTVPDAGEEPTRAVAKLPPPARMRSSRHSTAQAYPDWGNAGPDRRNPECTPCRPRTE